ncbi:MULTISPECIES: type VII secretion protein EssA [unclassified Granulicatella]|uniref:type VII secretion protein EssA n=1 Tax=unclassified Granulicatella TaxID=2630493 RepID=UPI00107365AE|nr:MULTISPECIES: type VII secretion protein EssA [unclassified Granulicatella]MBF0780480.1 type VII secretion protein EssA [Granulicatella sp. 19428wC4_WM01]TFU95379.1 type VII secretion protein EssA [Granulicatella sp. WM01]
MKKIVGYSSLIFCLSFFLLVSKVNAAEDGALKINTNIQPTQQSKGIHYIEQENDLSALFRLETTTSIHQQQDKEKLEERQDKNSLFINVRSSQRLVDTYTATLFNGQTNMTRTDNAHIVLNSVTSEFSLSMIVSLLIAVVIMGYSIIQVIISKKGQHK